MKGQWRFWETRLTKLALQSVMNKNDESKESFKYIFSKSEYSVSNDESDDEEPIEVLEEK